MVLKRAIEAVSFAVLLFWFITVESWNPLKYALLALMLLLVYAFARDKKFFWEQNGKKSKKSSRRIRR